MNLTANDMIDGDDFRAQLAALRPDLHRYCARLVGSAIDGEDIVQETIARAWAAVGSLQSLARLRPWLFRIAHNRSVDLLRQRARHMTDPLDDAGEVADEAPDALEALLHQEAITAALGSFCELSIMQRSTVILKDVLDQGLAEIADLLGLTVDAVKAHLARGRAKLRDVKTVRSVVAERYRPSLEARRYAALFNAGDWDALRTLLADDVRLNQATHPIRTGSSDVSSFFSIYASQAPVHLIPAMLEGCEVLAVFERPGTRPGYFMRIGWQNGRIISIVDYRYARYVVGAAHFQFQADHSDAL